jgi:hypothetical protein
VSRSVPDYRWRNSWLVASLVVNLLLMGLLFAWALDMNHPRPPSSWQRDVLPSLTTGDAEIVNLALARSNDIHDRGETLSGEQLFLLPNLIRADPFDRAKLEQTLMTIEKIRADQRDAITIGFLNELSALSPDGRAKMAAALEQEAHRLHPFTR